MLDPTYLLGADRAPLVAKLPILMNDQARAAGGTYRRLIRHLRSKPVTEHVGLASASAAGRVPWQVTTAAVRSETCTEGDTAPLDRPRLPDPHRHNCGGRTLLPNPRQQPRKPARPSRWSDPSPCRACTPIRCVGTTPWSPMGFRLTLIVGPAIRNWGGSCVGYSRELSDR
jgi:hypothetical protein